MSKMSEAAGLALREEKEDSRFNQNELELDSLLSNVLLLVGLLDNSIDVRDLELPREDGTSYVESSVTNTAGPGADDRRDDGGCTPVHDGSLGRTGVAGCVTLLRGRDDMEEIDSGR